VPHKPQELGWPVQDGAADASSPPLEAKTDNFLVNRLDPHFGQAVPAQRLDRTSTSESSPHFPQ
jgi:hypothetical protein